MADTHGPRTVLVVEDDGRLSEINRRALERAGYRVVTAGTLAQARRQFTLSAPDAILLDILLPDGSGVEFCREIREQTAAPIVFLTAVGGYAETMAGLAAGGDDYLDKPYDLELLLAKLAAFLRRDEIARRVREREEVYTRGPLTIDAAAGRALLGGQDMALTQKELGMLLLLARAEGGTLSKAELYQSVWGYPLQGDTNAMKTVVSRLRRKLEGSGFDIEAVRGKGYRLEGGD